MDLLQVASLIIILVFSHLTAFRVGRVKGIKEVRDIYITEEEKQ